MAGNCPKRRYTCLAKLQTIACRHQGYMFDDHSKCLLDFECSARNGTSIATLLTHPHPGILPEILLFVDIPGILLKRTPGGQSCFHEDHHSRWKHSSGEISSSRWSHPLLPSLPMRDIRTTLTPEVLLTPFQTPSCNGVSPTRTPNLYLGSPDSIGRPQINMVPSLQQHWGLLLLIHLLLQCQHPAL